MPRIAATVSALMWAGLAIATIVPSSLPATAGVVDSAQLSVSIEFFAFPGYTQLPSTAGCLANIQALRGAPPAMRIGGTTQDRATYDPSLTAAVNYTVADPSDAPDSLTYGPSFFTLASQMKGDVTVGLNRQLNNMPNTRSAAVQAKSVMPNLLAIELGNEPEFYSSTSPIIPAGQSWTPATDGASQKLWFTDIATSVGNIFQGAVYLQYPTWSTKGLIPLLGDAIAHVATFSGHSYPQSACNGAATNLPSLMSHSGIVSYTEQYAAEASAAHAQGKRYFLGETNSATCGGGGISPTFGAALWIVDYVIQGALNNVDRMYFHQGTIGDCQYCFWGQFTTSAPFYGVAFVSEFFGTDGTHVAMLDNGTTSTAIYAIYNAAGRPVRALVYNSAYFDGTTTRTSASVALSGLGSATTLRAKRLTAPNATSRVDEGAAVTIGGGGTFSGSNCAPVGTQVFESVAVSGGVATVNVQESEALIVYL